MVDVLFIIRKKPPPPLRLHKLEMQFLCCLLHLGTSV